MLVTSYEDYFYSTGSITLVNGTDNYALPTDVYKLRKVFYKEGTDRYIVRRMSLDDLSNVAGTVYPKHNYRYRMMGQRIFLSPIPGTGTLELWYVPEYAVLTSDSSTVALVVPVVGWDDYLVLCVAIRCLLKEESDVTALLIEKQAFEKRLVKAASERDAGEPESVIDVSESFSTRRVW
jgi:hypothetical protein